MKLVDVSIRYPVSVIVVVLFAVLFGALALPRIPIQMIPTIDKPEITVSTRYPDAGPLEVEEEITNRQEELLNTVENVREMLSTSTEGESSIVLQYDWGTDQNVARLDVSEKLGAVRDIPEDAEESIIRAANSNRQQPIGWIVLQSRQPINEVRPFAWDVIRSQLGRIDGVGQVIFFGGQEREVHIALDFPALAARGLMISDVRRALTRENRDIKAGTFDEGKRRFAVRTRGRYRKIADVEQTILRESPQGVVRVKDVARVTLGYEDPEAEIRSQGTPSIILGVLRKTGSNTLEVMRRVHERVDHLSRLYAGRGIHLQLVYDASTYIHESIRLVTTSLLIGALLATVVLLFFLRSRSAVLVLGLAIPIVLLSSFSFIKFFGRTINIISLAGMAFVSGMILDNAIVVVENIFRHREMGKDTFRAAADGTTEVWGAVLASTLTTLAVFIPIILVEDEAGQIFRDIAIVISIAVGLSLIVAITVIPMLAARLLKTPPRTVSGAARGPAVWATDRAIGILRVVLRSRLRKITTVAGILTLAIGISWILRPALDYLPEGNRNLAFVVLDTPPVYNLEQSERLVHTLEQRILAQPEVDRIFAIVRASDPSLGVILKAGHKDKQTIRNFIKRLRSMALDLPGIRRVFVRQVPLIRRGNTGSGNIEVRIKGDRLAAVEAISKQLEPLLEALPGVEFVNPSLEIGKPEFVVDVDRLRASELGVSVEAVGEVIAARVSGLLAGSFDDAGREIDLRLRGPEPAISSSREIEQTVLYTPSGQVVQLADLARVTERKAPTEIDHIDMDRAVKLRVGIAGDMPLGEAVERIEQIVAPLRDTLPLEESIELGGQANDLARTWIAFRGALLLALVITYLLLASLFESFRLPAVILFSVPFAASGGILGLRMMHALDPGIKLDVIAMLGFVILIGVVVNNAILLVHQTLHRLREGSPPEEALLDAVATRVRPILMTMTTTIFGMMPLLFASGAGSELYRGLGAILVGGLALATLFTLIVVPTLLSFLLSSQTAPEEPPATPQSPTGV